MEREKYAKELEVAVRVVHVACALCGRVQDRLLSENNDHVMSKDDDSPVTVAGILHWNLTFEFVLFSIRIMRGCVSCNCAVWIHRD